MAQQLYLRFCRKLARSGTVRAAHEGPQDFAERAAENHPRHAPSIQAITAQYLALRYENQPTQKACAPCAAEVAAFKL